MWLGCIKVDDEDTCIIPLHLSSDFRHHPKGYYERWGCIVKRRLMHKLWAKARVNINTEVGGAS